MAIEPLKNEQGGEWDAGWDEHRRHQMQRMARLPLVKKLEWLEQAHHLVLFMNKSRIQKEHVAADSPDSTPDHT